MRRNFCDRCDADIKGYTMGNIVTMPDDEKGIDLCNSCRSSLQELVRKWRRASPGTQ
jgi:hypothetical protein